MSSSINSVVLKQVEKALFFVSFKRKKEKLQSLVFQRFGVKQSELWNKKFSVGLSTLEEVFLELSKRDKFISDEDEEAPLQPGTFEKTITRLGKPIPLFSDQKNVYFTQYCLPHLAS